MQIEGEPVRSVVTTPFVIVSMGRLSILPLEVAIFTIFVAYGFWQNSVHRGGFHGSLYQMLWLACGFHGHPATYSMNIRPLIPR